MASTSRSSLLTSKLTPSAAGAETHTLPPRISPPAALQASSLLSRQQLFSPSLDAGTTLPSSTPSAGFSSSACPFQSLSVSPGQPSPTLQSTQVFRSSALPTQSSFPGSTVTSVPSSSSSVPIPATGREAGSADLLHPQAIGSGPVVQPLVQIPPAFTIVQGPQYAFATASPTFLESASLAYLRDLKAHLLADQVAQQARSRELQSKIFQMQQEINRQYQVVLDLQRQNLERQQAFQAQVEAKLSNMTSSPLQTANESVCGDGSGKCEVEKGSLVLSSRGEAGIHDSRGSRVSFSGVAQDGSLALFPDNQAPPPGQLKGTEELQVANVGMSQNKFSESLGSVKGEPENDEVRGSLRSQLLLSAGQTGAEKKSSGSSFFPAPADSVRSGVLSSVPSGNKLGPGNLASVSQRRGESACDDGYAPLSSTVPVAPETAVYGKSDARGPSTFFPTSSGLAAATPLRKSLPSKSVSRLLPQNPGSSEPKTGFPGMPAIRVTSPQSSGTLHSPGVTTSMVGAHTRCSTATAKHGAGGLHTSDLGASQLVKEGLSSSQLHFSKDALTPSRNTVLADNTRGGRTMASQSVSASCVL
ncbi:hypothetical protein CSUI_000563 [Cystoisospora suis]|uniref:Uncharacterized protein n=1 Tax=Cystoisospora suis TaxID=483139 RepID=A0A2C6LF15_9APIC|nr:hypothetical protein CSUI_000563 [Cystoisospora suis]